jgi:murein DD-endopeptidase MepM/ murein hydrolase activator NlpD
MKKWLPFVCKGAILSVFAVSCTPRTFYPGNGRLVKEDPAKDDKSKNVSDGHGQLGDIKPLDGQGGVNTNPNSEVVPAAPPYESTQQEYVATQTVGDGLPSGIHFFTWMRPAAYTSLGAFIGRAGSIAGHEGVDYVHTNGLVIDVPIVAASSGRVVYLRTGCLQSSMFSSNTRIRECGAGWGEHVVLDHGSGIFTRYAHMKPGSIVVKNGQSLMAGTLLGTMGNSGRSELRHLHFELGTKSTPFKFGESAQPFDRVFDSEPLLFR